jgi:hypothetical protein
VAANTTTSATLPIAPPNSNSTALKVYFTLDGSDPAAGTRPLPQRGEAGAAANFMIMIIIIIISESRHPVG